MTGTCQIYRCQGVAIWLRVKHHQHTLAIVNLTISRTSSLQLFWTFTMSVLRKRGPLVLSAARVPSSLVWVEGFLSES